MRKSLKRVSVLRRSSIGIIALTLVSQVAEAGTKTIGKVESGNLRVIVVESESGLSFALNSNSNFRTEDASVSFAQNPERLIVDLPAQEKLHETKTLTLSHRLIKSLRIGAHPEKTRVVLDLTDRQPSSHSLTVVEPLGALLLHLSFAQASSSPSPKSESTEVLDTNSEKENFQTTSTSDAPTPSNGLKAIATSETEGISITDNAESSKVEADVSLTLPVAPVTTQEQKREVIVAASDQGISTEVVPAVRAGLDHTGAFLNTRGVIVHRGETEEEPQTPPRLAQINSLKFITGKDKELDSLVANISNIQGFTLAPVAAEEYELRLRDAAISAVLPSRLGLGFVAVESQDAAPDSVIRIKVSPGVALAAELTAETLVLKATRH